MDALIRFCNHDLLGEKWLLAGTRRAAVQWKQRIVISGASTVNLHPMTLELAVRRLTDPTLRDRQQKYAGGSITPFLVQSALGELLESGQLRFFSRVEQIESLRRLAARTIADIRLAGLSADQFQTDDFDNADRAHDLAALLLKYEDHLRRHQLLDYADCLRNLLDLQGSTSELRFAVVDEDLAEHALEKQLVAKWADEGRLVDFAPQAEPKPTSSSELEIIEADGEMNEIRGLLRRILYADQPTPLDEVELLYTDYETYAPLVHNFFLARQDDAEADTESLPVTFAEGVTCIYSRPGRALRAWIRWLQADCPQSHLVQMIREGLLELENDEVGYGYARSAAVLRRVPIGLGRDRYDAQLKRAIDTANSKIAAAQHRDEEEESVGGHRTGGDFGLKMLKMLRSWVAKLLEHSPSPQTDQLTLLKLAERFLRQTARSVSRLDAAAAAKLTDDIEQLQRLLSDAPDLQFDIWSWLEELPTQSRVLSSGPQPGRLHVDHVRTGGKSGRKHLAVVGLDDSRLTQHSFHDPLLLDNERDKIAPNVLQSSVARRQRETQRFDRLFEFPYQSITLSYSTRSLLEDRQLFPSSAFQEAVRLLSAEPGAAPTPTNTDSFLTSDGTRPLTDQDEQLWKLLSASPSERDSLLEAALPHWVDGRRWKESVANTEHISAADGWTPDAGADLDPAGEDARPISPSALESFGTCPRRFFFRRGLRIQPPDELVLDDDRWLDPLTYGSLVHGVFEQFMIRLSSDERTPDYERDLPLLLKLLEDALGSAEQSNPVRHAHTKRRQVDDLRKTCEIFLREEQRYCQQTGARPFVMEASIGVEANKDEVDAGKPNDAISCPNAVRLTLPNGQAFTAIGVLDRVDRKQADGSTTFAIWDYKSGSDWGFEQQDPLQNGRKLQPYLYAGMLQHRLAEAGIDGQVAYFGYFFPSPRTNGRRIGWRTAALRAGDSIVETIFDLIRQGCFLPTTERDDCRFCDYLEICGDPNTTASTIRSKLANSDDEAVIAYRQLRGLDWETH